MLQPYLTLFSCAAVIAHEMAHVLARHSAETITGQILFLPVSIMLSFMLETSGGIFGQLHRLVVGLPGSRANETEADLIGMHLAARACYSPDGMVNMLKARCLSEPTLALLPRVQISGQSTITAKDNCLQIRIEVVGVSI